MIVVLALIAGVCLYGGHISTKGFDGDYLSIEKTTSVKGIFVLLVFLRHFKGYVTLNGKYDPVFLKLDSYLGQLIVVMFLFYSGYGMYESYRRKGKAYVSHLPRQRLLKTLIHFDLAVLCYLLLNLALGISYPPKTVFFAFFAWESIGNSNWFIWVTLLYYLLFFLGGKLFPKKPICFLLFFTMASIGYIVWFSTVYPDYPWWCDTALCFPAGLWYAYSRKYIDDFLSKRGRYFWISLLVFALFLLLFRYRRILAVYELLSLCFVMLILLFSKKVTLGNRVLIYFGKRVFPIYILQRFSMNLLDHFGLSIYPLLFLAVSFGLTLLLEWPFSWLLQQIDCRFFTGKTEAAAA